MPTGEFYLNGPIFVKSGVTLNGDFVAESWSFTNFVVYEDSTTSGAGEDAIIVIDGATDVMVSTNRM